MSDIPEFTIGAGAMNPSMSRADNEPADQSSTNSPSKDEEAPFKSL
jgi:hypothetical protein